MWYGGKGNTEQGICIPLALDWCSRVVKEQGMLEDLRAAGFWQLHLTRLGGKAKSTPEKKPYVKKGDGGDGQGNIKGEAQAPRRSGRHRG